MSPKIATIESLYDAHSSTVTYEFDDYDSLRRAFGIGLIDYLEKILDEGGMEPLAATLLASEMVDEATLSELMMLSFRNNGYTSHVAINGKVQRQPIDSEEIIEAILERIEARQ